MGLSCIAGIGAKQGELGAKLVKPVMRRRGDQERRKALGGNVLRQSLARGSRANRLAGAKRVTGISFQMSLARRLTRRGLLPALPGKIGSMKHPADRLTRTGWMGWQQ
jgi:hypothetical protein